ncbi:MAG: amino acid deaminase/aldolase, partial [Dehalococcoidia bacterium]|nr:amino acid deaminase/aldolase [Dehalococcoidia bacterium]
ALFDGHRQLANFQPSLFYAIQVVRKPAGGWVTAFGGGYYGSAAGKAPVVYQPGSLIPTGTEGFGEVQTPFQDPGASVNLGDLVILRPAKAGEPLERFNYVYPLSDGIVGEPMPTYRGEGKNFG